jgi:penicillin amidase
VISGKHTASGQPLLVHDPQLENVMPSQWYQINAFYKQRGKTYSISGISCSGIPFVVGKTNYAAVGMTTIYTDNQDLYREKV